MTLALRLNAIGQAPQLERVSLKEPAKGEARIKVAACGLNFADLLQIEGRYQERPALPYTLGMEMAGTVESLGPETDGPAPGTRVAVFAGSGGLAEAANVPVARLMPLPPDMSFAEAAGFQIAYGTSHLALTRRAALAPGETLVVTGAAGGVGLTAVEIGKTLGARVIAVARGADRLAVAKAAGADILIDSETADLKADLRALGGADVVYETIGGDLFAATLGALKPEGRMLTIGFAGGQVPPIAANHLLVKNISVIGLYWGGYLTFAPELLVGSLQTLLGWYSEGKLRPHISHLVPLADVDQALAMLRERKSTGKVVVTCERAGGTL
ncbi:MAG: NADPH:quinone oxidoreductase family protein [Paracoccaceae bacterium]